MRFGKSQWSSFDWGVYEVNAIPEVQVTNTRVDQWGFQGITILWEVLEPLFSRGLLRDLANLNGVPLVQGSLYTMGNNNNILREPLQDLGKSQWSSFIWVVYEGITAIWENLNGVPSLGGINDGIIARFGKISMESLHLGGL